MKFEPTSTSARYFQSRSITPSPNGVYDDYNECVFPHVYFASRRSIRPIRSSPNQDHPSRCPLLPYLGPRDGSRNTFPCDYSTNSSIPGDIRSMDYDVESDVSSLSGHEGGISSDNTPPRRNDFIPFLNYENNSRHGLSEVIRGHNRLNRGNTFMPFLNYYESNDETRSQTGDDGHIITRSYSFDDEDLSDEYSSYYTSGMTHSTYSSTEFGSNRDLKTTILPSDADEDTQDIMCLFDNKFFRDFMDKIFGRTRQLPVFEFPSSYEFHGFPPDVEELSHGSSSLESCPTHRPR